MSDKIPIHESLQFVDDLEQNSALLLGFDGFSKQTDGKWVQPIDRIADFTSGNSPKLSKSQRYRTARQIINEWMKEGFYKITHIEFVFE
jgi:hypothetical protein